MQTIQKRLLFDFNACIGFTGFYSQLANERTNEIKTMKRKIEGKTTKRKIEKKTMKREPKGGKTKRKCQTHEIFIFMMKIMSV